MADDPDREAILARRGALVALALAGLLPLSACGGSEPAPCLTPIAEEQETVTTPPCLSPVPPTGMESEPQVCLSVAMPPDEQDEPEDAPVPE